MLPAESVRLHGKLLLIEDDTQDPRRRPGPELRPGEDVRGQPDDPAPQPGPFPDPRRGRLVGPLEGRRGQGARFRPPPPGVPRARRRVDGPRPVLGFRDRRPHRRRELLLRNVPQQPRHPAHLPAAAVGTAAAGRAVRCLPPRRLPRPGSSALQALRLPQSLPARRRAARRAVEGDPEGRPDRPVDLRAGLYQGAPGLENMEELDRVPVRGGRTALGSARPYHGLRPSDHEGPGQGPVLGDQQQAGPDLPRRRSRRRASSARSSIPRATAGPGSPSRSSRSGRRSTARRPTCRPPSSAGSPAGPGSTSTATPATSSTPTGASSASTRSRRERAVRLPRRVPGVVDLFAGKVIARETAEFDVVLEPRSTALFASRPLPASPV